jgi:argininosuccinate synthase
MNGLTNRNKFSKLTLALAMTRNKVVLAFSGGLDTSVCVKYLQTDYKMDVITATIDCGQDDDLDAIKAKSELLGAVRHVNIDAKKEFVNNYVAKSIRANGLYQGRYPLATALARPLIATKIMELVQREGARYVSHGCTGKGNDQVRFDLAFHAIDPSIEILAPIRDLNLTRDLEVSYAQKNEIPLSNEIKKHSIDLNIWGRAIEGGELENPLFEVTDDVLQLVKTSAENSTEYITFEFKDGIPIAVDGKVMNLADLISYTNLKVGKHGVGLIDHIEDRVVGIKSREVYEAPAALAIIDSHMDLENMVLTRHELEFKQLVDMKWSWLIYCGLWFDPLRKDLDTFIDATQRGVTGKVRMKLQNRSMGVVGRESENSIYRNSLATYKSGSKFDQRLAKGFIELWGMQSVLANNLRAVPLEKEMCEQDKK